MEKYLIKGFFIAKVEREVEAENLSAAINQFQKENGKASIDSIGDKAFIGYDKTTGQPILEGDNYAVIKGASGVVHYSLVDNLNLNL